MRRFLILLIFVLLVCVASVSATRVQALSQSPKAGDRKVLTVDGVEFAFRYCPAGEFMMGSPEDEPERYSWEKQHRVRLTQGFWLLETEVTQAQWTAIMGTTVEEQAQKMLHDDRKYDSLGTKTLREFYGFSRDEPAGEVLCGVGPDRPIYYVNWNESVEFCRRLSSLLNREIKLPTEAQWEYACRAGSTGAYGGIGDLDLMGWYDDNSRLKTHEVGQKRPNAWGLYDMHGNVWEWCSDYYDEDYYDESPTSDPENRTETSPNRVDRGGSWCSSARYCRSAFRYGSEPGYRNYNLGLRVLLVPSSRD